MRQLRIFQSLFLSAIYLAAVYPADASPLNSSILTPLIIPKNCHPPTSVGCGVTTQPITAFGAIEPTIVNTSSPPSISFSGTWSSPVAPAWLGTFTATGFYPAGSAAASTSTWNFSGLGLGLPTGTFMGFGDLDNFGGSPERYELIAFDSSGKPILSPWLGDVFFVSSLNACATECVQAAMPAYQWTAATGMYAFDGSNVTALNPTDTVWVTTNKNIFGLSVKKFSQNNSFVLAAPVAIPEPDSLLLVGLGLAVLLSGPCWLGAPGLMTLSRRKFP